MKKSSILALTLVMTSMASAQTTFTEQIQAPAKGAGTIILEHDPRLDSIVNAQTELLVRHNNPVRRGPTTEHKVMQNGLNLSESALKQGARQKAAGYRIQVYFGSNQREDKTKAQQMGNKVASRFPELRSYVSFESPHWRCRVGDFATREEASHYVRRLKAAGISPDAMIVNSEVFIVK